MIKLPLLHQSQLFLPRKDCPHNVDTIFSLKEQECVCFLKKCKSIDELKQVHGKMLKLGLLSNPFCVSNFLATCALSDWGTMDYASSVFSQFDDPDAFQFNTMIRGHARDGDFQAALSLFAAMLESEISPDKFTFPFVLKACGCLEFEKLGQQMHGQVYKFGLQDDVFVQNSLISMYGKCEHVSDCRAVFEGIDQKTVASWSAVVGAHANFGMWWDCLKYFGDMIRKGNCRAEETILVSLLSACAHVGALDSGRSIHGYLLRNLSSLNVIVETSLIDMYMKCGSSEKGVSVFHRMSSKNQWSYSAMISGLAMHGHGEAALLLFSDMLKQGIKPDDVLYLGVLSACRHAGLVEEGTELLNRMKIDHQIQPTIHHYGCVLDLLGRAAMFDEAFNLIQNMPMAPNDVIWRSILSAATVHHNLDAGEQAAKNLMQLHSKNAGDYVLTSNMYAQVRKWTDAAVARSVVANQGLDQAVGVSMVEVKRRFYSFVSQDKEHCFSEGIFETIHQMEWQLKFAGYKPDISEVLQNVDAEEKRQRLRYHSQKLALAFALLHTPQGTTIRVVRNVRMCRDTHTYTKFISDIFDRKIIVRDRNRFHLFKGGTCSCRDYW